MKTRLLLFLVLAEAARAAVTITDLRPTVLFPNNRQGPLEQLAWLSVVNSGTAPLACQAVVKVNGTAGTPQNLTLPAGSSRQDVLIPDLAQPATVEVDLSAAGGQALAARSQAWQPQRKWIIYLVKSSHEDLGYEDFIYAKQHQIAEYVDLGAKLSGPKENAPDASGKPSARDYHYTLETLLFERNYLDERSEAAWRRIVEDEIKPGKMELMGAPSSDHTQWMDYEELARSNYPGRRENADRFGLDLKTYMIVDNPSMSWSAAQAAADAGFRYVLRLGQPWRTGGGNDPATIKLPPIFWWEGPDGASRVLYAWCAFYGGSFWYGDPGAGGQDLSMLARDQVNAEVGKIQTGGVMGPYPYDAAIISAYQDHEIPKWDARAIRHWQSNCRYPEIRIAGINDFFAYIERKYGPQLPVVRGELNNFSGDYATIDPAAQGWKRQAARLLPLAEGVAALASLRDPAYQPPNEVIDRAYLGLTNFTEHSWPTSPPALDIHLFNAQWVKRREAREDLDLARTLVQDGLARLLRTVPTKTVSVAVFNPLAHPRTDVAKIDGAFPALVDAATGAVVPTQVSDGQTVFLARDVPAYGYRVYEVAAGGASAKAASAPTADAGTIGNEFYTIRFDPQSGAITSVFDKQLQREFVAPAAKYQFNQMILVHKNSRDGKQGSNSPVTTGARLTPSAGPMQAEMRADIDDAKTGAAITQKVVLYAGVKRIDIINDLRHASALNAAERKERYRQNIYYAFPVDVKDFTARVEYPGGVIRPAQDLLPWGSHDFLNANWWADVSNAQYGVTMAPWNATTLNFGDIRYNQLAADYQPASSYLFSYAWSNRMSGLLELSPEEWNASLGYSFTSHAGNWNSGAATQFGWAVASPLAAITLPAGQKGPLPAQKSFLSINAPNVQLTTLKQSTQPGRGWVARLVETEGRATTAIVDLSAFPVEGAMLCDLVENDQTPLPVKNGQVTVTMRPFSFATIRFFAAPRHLSTIVPVSGHAISDAAVELAWKAEPDAAAYLIYRSTDPAGPATLYNLVGRSTTPKYEDRDLALGTTYYYHVAPVTAENELGPISALTTVTTDSRNISPPLPVTGLGVVRDDSARLTLYWQKSPDPDVARYFIFRAEKAGATTTEPIATVTPTDYFLQTYVDGGLKPATTYFYKVLAEDWAGHRQTISPETSATTPRATAAQPDISNDESMP